MRNNSIYRISFYPPYTHKISRISTDIYKCRNIPHQTTLYEDFFHFLYNWGNTNQLIIRSNILLA